MALKAGTVGIDPKYVDKNGKPVSDVDLSNYYTKRETDTKLDLKANLSNLTANNKKFQFAYDAESGKYGYKAGAQDDFHPFESAGGAGWVKPADLITTGLVYSNAELEEGGYVTDSDYLYVDIILHKTGSSAPRVDIPVYTASATYFLENMRNVKSEAEDYASANGAASSSSYSGDQITRLTASSSAADYYHFFGQFKITTP